MLKDMLFKSGFIDKYKDIRKQGFLKLPLTYKKKYAMIGVGGHSISNIYPVLYHLGVPLRYIVTRQIENAQNMAQRFSGCEGTNDLDKVLNDPEIEGVFISASPTAHFQLASKAIRSQKHVLVEKPPCTTADELEKLIVSCGENAVRCIAGVQKRFAPAYQMLKKKMSHIRHYAIDYQTGSYPEGDAILDLFIHPIDLAVYLFGEITAIQQQKIEKGDALTIQLLLEHQDDIKGSLQLSTDYAWNVARESVMVNCAKGVFTADNFQSLEYLSKSPRMLGIPLEKVMGVKHSIDILFQASDFIPLSDFNQLVTQGFYGEIQHFLNLVEKGKAASVADLYQLRSTYSVMSKLQNA